MEIGEYMGRADVTKLFGIPVRESDAMQVKETPVAPFAA